MKVILKQDVDNLGDAGEIVDVTDGYGSNYLMPRGLAMRATKGALKDAEAIARARRQRAAQSLEEAREHAQAVERSTVTLSAKASEDGQLYGSVGVNAIAKAATQQLGVTVDRKQLELDRAIKTVGEHEVPVRVHKDVAATLRLEITAEA
jgi:large subunit ribosomal protein L9